MERVQARQRAHLRHRRRAWLRGHPRGPESARRTSSEGELRGPLGRRAALSMPSTGHVCTHLVATANVLEAHSACADFLRKFRHVVDHPASLRAHSRASTSATAKSRRPRLRQAPSGGDRPPQRAHISAPTSVRQHVHLRRRWARTRMRERRGVPNLGPYSGHAHARVARRHKGGTSRTHRVVVNVMA